MDNIVCTACAILLALTTTTADTRIHRSRAARAEFARTHPCPSTGQPRGACPGYVIDHIIPLCAGGRDATDNMQWQPIIASKLKDRMEREMCRG